MMTNMPSAAQGLALLEGVPACYGQHTNICTGHPLTDPARIPSLCGPCQEKEKQDTVEGFLLDGGLSY